MTTVVGEWIRKLGGTAGAQHVADVTQGEWVIKPRLRSQVGLGGYPLGTKGTVTEFIAAKLAERIGLPVPEHRPLYLPQQVISRYPGLSAFESGYVLGVKYEDGWDLLTITKLNLTSFVLGSLFNTTNAHTAIGIVTSDTWMANADRAYGSPADLAAQAGRPTSNDGNLYFARAQGAPSELVMKPIDLGHSFWNSSWGQRTSTDAWPEEMFGAMRFFFQAGWMTKDFTIHDNDFREWVDKVSNLDLSVELLRIRQEMPTQWIQGDPALAAFFDSSDWTDLETRLARRNSILWNILTSKYSIAAQRYAL